MLAAVYRELRRLAQRLTGRIRPLRLVVQLLLLVRQVAVMWLFYVGGLLARWAARVSEYAADGAAANWGYGPQLAALYAAVGDGPPRGTAGAAAAGAPADARADRAAHPLRVSV